MVRDDVGSFLGIWVPPDGVAKGESEEGLVLNCQQLFTLFTHGHARFLVQNLSKVE